MKIQRVSQPDENDDHEDLNHNADKKIQQIGTEKNQMIVVVVIHVHDFHLQIGGQVRQYGSRDHGGNDWLGLFPSHVKAAVDGMGRDHHGKKNQGCGNNRTVNDPQIYV